MRKATREFYRFVTDRPAAVESTPIQRTTLLIATLSVFFALTVYSTAPVLMPNIAPDLGAGPGSQAWLLACVSFGFATALLTAGSLGDDYGRRRVLVGGLIVLEVAAFGCALAPNAPLFLVAGFFEGVGGAAVMATSLGLIAHAFPEGPARAKAIGVWGAGLGAGIGTGPLLGAAMSQGPGWRWAFAVTAVAAGALAVLAKVRLVESRALDHRPVDAVGAILLSSAVGAGVAGVVEARSGWGRPSVAALLGLALVLAVAFVLTQLRRPAPMLDMALFRRPDFVAVTVAALTMGLSVIAQLTYISVLLQRGLGHTVWAAALCMGLWSAVSVATVFVGRGVIGRLGGRHQMALGLLINAVGLLAVTGIHEDTSLARLLPGVLLAGVGCGVLNVALGREAVASVPAGRGSLGTGANTTARYLGSSIGISIVATVVAAAGPTPRELVEGWNHAAFISAGLAVVGAVAVLLCRPRPEPQASPARGPRRRIAVGEHVG
ncbi:MAG: MFS transporter [Sporichthyaceae bacterium]